MHPCYHLSPLGPFAFSVLSSNCIFEGNDDGAAKLRLQTCVGEMPDEGGPGCIVGFRRTLFICGRVCVCICGHSPVLQESGSREWCLEPSVDLES